MKYRTGKDEKSEVRVYKHLPEGWKVLKGTQTQPVGTVWASNGEPVFKRGKDGKLHKNPKYKQALVVRDEKLMVTRIEQARRYERNDRRRKRRTKPKCAVRNGSAKSARVWTERAP